MMTKTNYLISQILILFLMISCNTMRLKDSDESYEVINAHYFNKGSKTLSRKTVDIRQYADGLGNRSAWQDANNDLGNTGRPKIDFLSMFQNDEFEDIIGEFVNQGVVKLDRKKIKGGIELQQKAKNSISFPYIFTNNSTKYALMYTEIVEGIENAAGGITLFRFEDGVWKDVFYFHLWIS